MAQPSKPNQAPQEQKQEAVESRVLFGFWHNKLGAKAKLVCWGWGSGEYSEAIAAFVEAYPGKSLKNLTLTTDRTEEQYKAIAEAQAAGEEKV